MDNGSQRLLEFTEDDGSGTSLWFVKRRGLYPIGALSLSKRDRGRGRSDGTWGYLSLTVGNLHEVGELREIVAALDALNTGGRPR